MQYESWELDTESGKKNDYKYFTRFGEILHWGLATEIQNTNDGSQIACVYNVAIVLTSHDNKIVEVPLSMIKVRNS